MIRRRLPWDTYNRAITFLYGERDEINRYLKKVCGKDDASVAPSSQGKHVVYQRDGHRADYIILIRQRRYSRKVRRIHEFAVLAHETLHCTGWTLRNAGIPLTDETEEAYTYYQQWLFSQCARHIPT